MNFNSIDFIVFFCILFALYFFIPGRFRWVYLLGASLFFYGYKKPLFLFYLVIPVLLVYFFGLKIGDIPVEGGDKKKRKLFLLGGLVSALSLLLVLRYTNFIRGMFVGEGVKPLSILVPLGLSFFTFKMVSYLVDVYNEKMKAERHPGYFALYVSFFPQISSGPIDRAVSFIPQLRKEVSFDMDRVMSGFQLVLWGIFKKMVIADRIAIFVNQVFASPDHQGLNLLLGAYLYAFQIYCDFSGYTDMAIGLSRVLGFESMKNFDYPYTSKSIQQFWNKWHISLSTWLRDYLFLPIAYAVMRPIKSDTLYKVKAETWGYMIGMLTTMFLAGLWHGPSWTFVVWGLLHGFYLVVGYTTKKSRKKFVKLIRLNKLPRVHRALSVFITFNLVSIAWIFFRSETLEKAFTYFHYIQLKPSGKAVAYMLFSIILAVLFILLEILYKKHDEKKIFDRIPVWVRIAGLAFFICLIFIFAVDQTNEFIYFQF